MIKLNLKDKIYNPIPKADEKELILKAQAGCQKAKDKLVCSQMRQMVDQAAKLQVRYGLD